MPTLIDAPFAWPMGQNDTLPTLTGTLVDNNGVPVDLTFAISVTFSMSSRDGRKVIVDAPVTILAPSAGRVEYVWLTGDTANAGDYTFDFVVTFPSGRLTFTNVNTKGIIRIAPGV